MTTTITTRVGKGGRLSFTEMDANFTNLQATADAAAVQATTYLKSEVDSALATKQAALGFTPQDAAGKNVANGYPGLDSSGKISTDALPAIAITDTFVVASQAAMLALTAQTGDVAVRTDLNKTFILKGTSASTLVDWQELLTPIDSSALALEITNRTAADATTLASAKTYADSKSVTTLASAKSYTDSETTARIAGDASTLLNAKIYADSAVYNEMVARNAAVSGMQDTARQIANDVVAAEYNRAYAAEYALSNSIDAEITARTAADAATLASANTYTDGAISTEVTARNLAIANSVPASVAKLTTARTINGVSFDGTANISFGTDSVVEGTTNKYYTDARARAAISVTGSGSYNSTTGVITVTGGVTTVAGKSGAVVLAVADVSGAAPLASPTFTGTVTLPAGSKGPGLLGSVSNMVMASGSTQGTASTLSSDVNIITSSSVGSGVVLPSAQAGKYIVIVNRSTNPIKVYPTSAAQIDGLGTNTAISLPVNGFLQMYCMDSLQWYTTTNTAINASAIVGSVTTATTATNIAGGIMGQLLYQTNLGQTGFVTTGLTGQILTAGASGPTWTSQNAITLQSSQVTSALGFTPASSGSNTALSLVNGAFGSATLTTSAVTANQVVDSIAITAARSVKYLIQITSGTSYHAMEMLIIHDGTNAYASQSNDVFTGVSLASFDSTIVGGNLQLLVTPVNAVSTIKVIRTSVTV